MSDWRDASPDDPGSCHDYKKGHSVLAGNYLDSVNGRIVGFPEIWPVRWPNLRDVGRVGGVSRELISQGDPMLRLSASVRCTHSADGAVILDIRQGSMFRFNPTGSRVLELLSAGADEKAIVSSLVEEFSADPATAAADTGEFLTLLREHALLEA